ncbi:hypothetical protein R3P38DRAFT_2757369 [Favolaschia claudopus]|uniref:Uncharacterized protein n=1 Tax=Favolaschia claudopus TaxID=2862362 RepID=A0AAW0EKF5_9AGAR
MFTHIYPKSRPPVTQPSPFPRAIIQTLLAEQDVQINAYRRRLDQIHQAEKRRKENPNEDIATQVEEAENPFRDAQAVVDLEQVWSEYEREQRERERATPSPSPSSSSESSESLLSVDDFLEWLRDDEDGKGKQKPLGSLDLERPLPPIPPSPVSDVHSIHDNEELHRLFPDLPPVLITKIVEHEFKPMDLAKLNPRRREEKWENGCSFADYPSMYSLLAPISSYFCVLQAGMAIKSESAEATRVVGQSGMRYIAHLIELDVAFQWGAVVQYHMQFHNDRRQEMVYSDYSKWAVPDAKLIKKVLEGRERTGHTYDVKLYGRKAEQRVVLAERYNLPNIS